VRIYWSVQNSLESALTFLSENLLSLIWFAVASSLFKVISGCTFIDV